MKPRTSPVANLNWIGGKPTTASVTTSSSGSSDFCPLSGSSSGYKFGLSSAANPRRQRRYSCLPSSPLLAILPGNRLNLWRGFGVFPKKGKWKLMRNHIYYVLGAGDRKAGRYIIRWLAYMLQHPGEVGETVLVRSRTNRPRWRNPKVDAALGELLEEQKAALPKDITARQFLQMVMRGEIDPPPKQVNAAKVLIEYEEAKLSALAVSQIPANDFAAALERAIKRSQSPPSAALLLPPEQPADELKKPMARLRRNLR